MVETDSSNGWSRVGIIISGMIAIAAAVAAHFDGVNSAKAYTDQRIDKLEIKIDKTFDKLSDMQSDISAIKVSLPNR